MPSNVFHYVKIVMDFVEKGPLSRNPLDFHECEQRLFKFKRFGSIKESHLFAQVGTKLQQLEGAV